MLLGICKSNFSGGQALLSQHKSTKFYWVDNCENGVSMGQGSRVTLKSQFPIWDELNQLKPYPIHGNKTEQKDKIFVSDLW